jgi:hypothetical protein
MPNLNLKRWSPDIDQLQYAVFFPPCQYPLAASALLPDMSFEGSERLDPCRIVEWFHDVMLAVRE